MFPTYRELEWCFPFHAKKALAGITDIQRDMLVREFAVLWRKHHKPFR